VKKWAREHFHPVVATVGPARGSGQLMAIIKAVAPTADNADTTLPDPTAKARWALLILIVSAFAIALVMNAAGWTGKPFSPAQNTTANFALFAGFYVAAQVIERLMQLVSPLVPFWQPYADNDPDPVKAAHLKADRAPTVLGIASVLGVAASGGFGLFFLTAIGMHVSHTIDCFFTGITIAAGTKPLHDFISLIQNQNSPKTGSGTG
jgi:hypothetical protein